MEIYKLVYIIEKENDYLSLLGKAFYRRNRIRGYFIYNGRKFLIKEKIKTKNIKKHK